MNVLPEDEVVFEQGNFLMVYFRGSLELWFVSDTGRTPGAPYKMANSHEEAVAILMSFLSSEERSG
jgi:hypothetical protein